MTPITALLTAPLPDPPDRLGGISVAFLWVIVSLVVGFIIAFVAIKVMMNGLGDQKVAKSGVKVTHVILGLFLLVAATGLPAVMWALYQGATA